MSITSKEINSVKAVLKKEKFTVPKNQRSYKSEEHYVTQLFDDILRNQEYQNSMGKNYNIFKILGLETYEVRTHSAFLADLLNPKGTHGQGTLYLTLFIKIVFAEESNNFEVQSAKIEVEKYIGRRNEISGGYIDILITDKNDNRIIIENKIYAKDQENQLLRYYNNYDSSPHLLYLTLNGEEASKISLGDKPNLKYKAISYKKHILKWLDECQEQTHSLPVIKETIFQYINLIKELTNQGDNEMEAIILSDPKYIDIIRLCNITIEKVYSNTNKKFECLLREKFDEKPLFKKESILLTITWGIDGDGFYFGYQLKENENNISGSKQGKEISLKIKDLLNKENIENYSSDEWVAWFYTKPFKKRMKFRDLDNSLIIKFYNNNEKLQQFVEDLLMEEQKIRGKVIALHLKQYINNNLNSHPK